MRIPDVPTLKTGRLWRYRWPWKRFELEKAGVELCNAPGRDHGGIRNRCLRNPHHPGKHKDLWKDRW